MADEPQPRSVPGIRLSLFAAHPDLAEIARTLNSASAMIFLDGWLRTAAEKLDVQPTDVKLTVVLMWLLDQLPAIGSAVQRAAYERQATALIAKAGSMPVVQYASSIDGVLIVPTMQRILKWDDTQFAKGAK